MQRKGLDVSCFSFLSLWIMELLINIAVKVEKRNRKSKRSFAFWKNDFSVRLFSVSDTLKMRGKNVISSWAGFIFIEYTRQIWYFYVDVLFHLFASGILHTPVGSGEVEQSIGLCYHYKLFSDWYCWYFPSSIRSWKEYSLKMMKPKRTNLRCTYNNDKGYLLFYRTAAFTY